MIKHLVALWLIYRLLIGKTLPIPERPDYVRIAQLERELGIQ